MSHADEVIKQMRAAIDGLRVRVADLEADMTKLRECNLARILGLRPGSEGEFSTPSQPAPGPSAASGGRCPDNLTPGGPACPRCGGNRGPSGVDGGSWVHWDGVVRTTVIGHGTGAAAEPSFREALAKVDVGRPDEAAKSVEPQPPQELKRGTFVIADPGGGAHYFDTSQWSDNALEELNRLRLELPATKYELAEARTSYVKAAAERDQLRAELDTLRALKAEKAVPEAKGHIWGDTVNDSRVCGRCGAEWLQGAKPAGPCVAEPQPPAERPCGSCGEMNCGCDALEAERDQLRRDLASERAEHESDLKALRRLCGALVNVGEYRAGESWVDAAERTVTELRRDLARAEEARDGVALTLAEVEDGLRATIADRDHIIEERDAARAYASELEAELANRDERTRELEVERDHETEMRRQAERWTTYEAWKKEKQRADAAEAKLAAAETVVAAVAGTAAAAWPQIAPKLAVYCASAKLHAPAMPDKAEVASGTSLLDEMANIIRIAREYFLHDPPRNLNFSEDGDYRSRLAAEMCDALQLQSRPQDSEK